MNEEKMTKEKNENENEKMKEKMHEKERQKMKEMEETSECLCAYEYEYEKERKKEKENGWCSYPNEKSGEEEKVWEHNLYFQMSSKKTSKKKWQNQKLLH